MNAIVSDVSKNSKGNHAIKAI